MSPIKAFRGRTGTNVILNLREIEIDSCNSDAPLVMEDFKLPLKSEYHELQSNDEDDNDQLNIEDCSQNQDRIYRCSNQEKANIFAGINSFNAINLFAEFNKIDSDRLATSNRKLVVKIGIFMLYRLCLLTKH